MTHLTPNVTQENPLMPQEAPISHYMPQINSILKNQRTHAEHLKERMDTLDYSITLLLQTGTATLYGKKHT